MYGLLIGLTNGDGFKFICSLKHSVCESCRALFISRFSKRSSFLLLLQLCMSSMFSILNVWLDSIM